jgi:hypothetical protein
MFEAHCGKSKKFTRRMAINMADQLDMDVWGLIKELERQGLLRLGSTDWFKRNGGFTQEHFDEARAS